MRWFDALSTLQQSGEAYVMVTVIGANGSTPRDTGTKMLVSASHCYDTIGGGHLEYKAIDKARELLLEEKNAQVLEHYPLAAKLGQCCGGHATLLFEAFAPSGIDIVLFGAGHVGKALTTILGQLPVRIRWIDNREAQFPAQEMLAERIQTLLTDDPVGEVAHCKPGSFYIVMTHNHGLDFDIVEAILKRGDSQYLGVIGSETKASRFKKRLSHRDFTETQINHMRSPMGLPDVPGKLPMEVAVSIAAEVIGEYHNIIEQPAKRQGLQWRELKSLALNTSS